MEKSMNRRNTMATARKRGPKLWLTIALTVGTVASLHAQVAPTAIGAWSMRQLVQAASIIAIVEVHGTHSTRDLTTGAIDARTELIVQQSFWGAENHQVLEVRTRSGTLPGSARMRQPILGEAQFSFGEHALVFLQPFVASDGSNALRPVGMSQGVFHIMRGLNGGNMVQYSGGATVVVLPETEPALLGTTPSARVIAALEPLISELHPRR